MDTIIHWFRRDLRISDNTSLYEAWSRSECLIPVYIWDDSYLRSPQVGAAQLDFLLRSLEALEKNLANLGHRLVVRHGNPAVELVQLARSSKANAVFTNREYEPQAIHRDRDVASALYQAGVYFESFKDLVLWEGREILNQSGQPYTVFTPYAKAWRTRPVTPPLPRLGKAKRPAPTDLRSLPLPQSTADLGHPSAPAASMDAGEHAGQAVLKRFLESPVDSYHQTRDFPANETGTSRLSPHLRIGTLGIRTVLHKLHQARIQKLSSGSERGPFVWETELIWREFYQQILVNFPHVVSRCFRPEYDNLEWSGTEAQFTAWRSGETGFPIIDAAQRCLNATGWMHNRLRMISAMFLTKDLLISWQRGEQYFMKQLTDADLGANNGGWQWSAGTGTDAAPYFRIFNPVSQGERFDPDGTFVRQWVPELASLPPELIHRPWETSLLASTGRYPQPIVDHGSQRVRCLAMFKAVKGT